MLNNPKLLRQSNGCGYELPVPRPDVWMPPGGELGFKAGAKPLTTCAGYSTKLPEVAEASRASYWLKRGDLRAFLDGERPTEHLVDAIDIYDTAAAHKDNYYMTPADKGGGG